MANHKRRRAPNARGGCAMCKPWKKGGTKGDASAVRFNQYRKQHKADEEIRDGA